MKYWLLGLIILFLSWLTVSPQVLAAPPSPETPPVSIYIFHSNGCPHCADLLAWLRGHYQEFNPQPTFYLLEVSNHPQNLRLFAGVGELTDQPDGGVPFIVVGNQYLIGYQTGVTGLDLQQMVSSCVSNHCPSPLDNIIATASASLTDLFDQPIAPPAISVVATASAIVDTDSSPIPDLHQSTTLPSVLHLPIFGTINPSLLSLPLLTVVLGLLDGFNPCAMWVLLFLISLLLGMTDRKRMWLLGFTFIGTSALIYLLFLTAWLNFFLYIGWIPIVRIIIGAVALISGYLHLNKWRQHQTGCEVVPDEKRHQIFGRLQAITQNHNLVLALIGIALLAISVNIVELVCSAGLPAIFTNTLSLSHLSWWRYAFYLALYLLMFMLDDLLVFIIAIKTLEVTGISAKYTHWANLVGGIVIALLGLALIFRPDLVMGG